MNPKKSLKHLYCKDWSVFCHQANRWKCSEGLCLRSFSGISDFVRKRKLLIQTRLKLCFLKPSCIFCFSLSHSHFWYWNSYLKLFTDWCKLITNIIFLRLWGLSIAISFFYTNFYAFSKSLPCFLTGTVKNWLRESVLWFNRLDSKLNIVIQQKLYVPYIKNICCE
jgi:hypothetical protein